VGARFSTPVQTGPGGPPSLLYNGCRVFPGGRKRLGRAADPSPLSSAEVYKQSRTIPQLSLRAFVAYEKGETHLSDINRLISIMKAVFCEVRASFNIFMNPVLKRFKQNFAGLPNIFRCKDFM
jgi:hypothetical protein